VLWPGEPRGTLALAQDGFWTTLWRYLSCKECKGSGPGVVEVKDTGKAFPKRRKATGGDRTPFRAGC
jgi:hypothetical protein